MSERNEAVLAVSFHQAIFTDFEQITQFIGDAELRAVTVLIPDQLFFHVIS